MLPEFSDFHPVGLETTMRRSAIAIALFFAISLIAQQPSPSKERITRTAEVRTDFAALEKEWLRAQDEGDIPVLSAMYDDDFTGTTFSGKLLSRADILANDEGPRTPKERSVLEDVQSKTFGNTAVVLGQVKSGALRYRFTKVYVNKEGAWKLVTAHLSRVTP